jgi:hypothetical protein
MSSVAEHLKQVIHFENRAALLPIFDTERPIQATGDILPWYTGKACEHVNHSHINMAVFDSRWEASEAFELDRSPLVAAWVKNDRLGFEITYSFRGIIRKFHADYLVRLANRKMLVLGLKGQDNQEQQTKREFLGEWIRAVNRHGGFGAGGADVSRNPPTSTTPLAARSRHGHLAFHVGLINGRSARAVPIRCLGDAAPTRGHHSARPDNYFGFDFQCDVMVTNLFIEFKIRRGGTGYKPRSTTERQVLECPLDENQEPILKGDEIHHVDTGPQDPGKQA